MADVEDDQYDEDIGDVENDLIDDVDPDDEEASDDDEVAELATSEIIDYREEHQVTAVETLITNPAKWSTAPFLTEYEYTSILSKRATMLQVSNDACIDDIEGLTPEEIAKEEIRQRRCPFAVKRRASERPVTFDFIPVNYLLLSVESMMWVE